MASYVYAGYRETENNTMERITGNITATDSHAAAIMLRQKGITPFKISRQLAQSIIHSQVLGKSTVIKSKEQLVLCRQLAVMLRAGMPVGDAIRLLAEQDNGTLQQLLKRVYERLESGMPISAAFGPIDGRDMFPRSMVALIVAGEQGGVLDAMLGRYANIVQKRIEVKNKLQSAMTYPCVLLIASTVIMGIMIFGILPIFAGIFRSTQAQLPWPTQFVLGIGDILTNYCVGILSCIVAVITLSAIYFRNSENMVLLGKWLCKIPVVGDPYFKLQLMLIFDTMSILIGAGIIVDEAVRITGRVTENNYIQRCFQIIENCLRGGGSVANAFKRSGILYGQPIIQDLITAGEAVGELELMLEQSASLCRMEANERLDTIGAMLEPVMIVCIGLVVGFMVIAIMLPIFDMMSLYN